MGRRNRNGLAWARHDGGATAATEIGTYRVAAGGGQPGVGAFFLHQQGRDEQALGRYATAERAKERCETHFNEMKHVLGRRTA